MDRDELIQKLTDQAYAQDELTTKLIEAVRAYGADLDAIEALQNYQTAMQLSRTSLLWEASTTVSQQNARGLLHRLERIYSGYIA